MGFTLEKVVPWGRSFDEYVSMFSLSAKDLQKKILGCGDGPAGFNAELTERGGTILSVDPIYKFSVDEIRNRISATYDKVIEQTKANQEEFVWKNIKTVGDLGLIRMEAMNRFLEDYPNGDERYMVAELPSLPFKDQEFELALCSHFLFLYSEQLSLEFHIQSLRELCRIASETRIFPILELGAKRSRHIDKATNDLSKHGFQWSIDKTPYEFQKGGNEMLRIKSLSRS